MLNSLRQFKVDMTLVRTNELRGQGHSWDEIEGILTEEYDLDSLMTQPHGMRGMGGRMTQPHGMRGMG